ncbi:MAG: restriction endonuclease subunit S [Pontiellaceae bacterium]|nr:restriction endonuclease subunit S [Pontiellaceae bacterium]
MKADWPEIPLGNFLTERREVPDESAILSGTQPIISKIRFSDGGIEFRTSGESKTNLISIHPGDLVLSGINAAKGAIALYEPSASTMAAATIHYSAYNIDQAQVNPKFLWLLLRHTVFSERLSQHVPNGIKTELKAKKFLPIPVPIPPLSEQSRLVDRINEIAIRFTEAQHIFESAQEDIDNLLGAMISDSLSSLTLDKCLEDVLLEKPKNGWSPKCDGAENGFPVLSLSAVYRYSYNPSAFKITSRDVNVDANYWLSPGDLLISRSNSIDLVGNAAIYNGNPFPCIYPDLLMKLKVNPVLADTQFVHYWLQSRTVRRYIRKNAKGTSPSMKKISQGTVMNIPWPGGISVTDQQNFVQCFDKYAKAVSKLQRNKNTVEQELETLMPALLDQAFRGEL